MDKKIVLLFFGVLGVATLGILILNPLKQKNLLSPANTNQQPASEITSSKTLKTYTDPSGFSFNYPDNLSLLNNELKDEGSYAELQLSASGIAGSLFLKIADSKLASLDGWVKDKSSSTEAPKDRTLGNLKALEIKSNDKLMLGALDQGILFTIEVPIGENEKFWREVLNIVVTDFSFAPPTENGGSQDSSSSDVTYDGEEVVE